MLKKAFTYQGKRYWIRAKTPDELAAKIAVRKYELEHPTAEITRCITVIAWGKEYIETYRRDHVSHDQYMNLLSQLKIIDHVIGGMPVEAVKKIHCEKVLSYMRSKNYSRDYMSKVRGLMKSMFEEAIDNDLLIKPPFMNLKIPAGAKPKVKRRPATESEKKMLLAAGERLGDPYDAYIKLMLYFGLRPSEAARVQGCHFDLEKRALRVQGTKTKNATRDVPIPESLVLWVMKYQKEPFKLILLNRDGRAMQKEALYRLWRAIRRDVHINGGGRLYRNEVKAPYVLPDDLTAYCLRHTYASDRIADGLPKEILYLIMGHADEEMSDTYIHITEHAFKAAKVIIDQAKV